MNDNEIVTYLSRKYKLTEKEVKSYYDIYWNRYVLKNMNSLEYDAIEVLGLGVFVPKLRSILFLIYKHFNYRRYLKKEKQQGIVTSTLIESVENKLRKLIKLKRILKKANEKRYKKIWR